MNRALTLSAASAPREKIRHREDMLRPGQGGDRVARAEDPLREVGTLDGIAEEDLYTDSSSSHR
jgi:hypothetical protein